MSQIKTDIQSAVKQAMREKQKDRLTTLRMIAAAIKQIEVDERIDVDDERALGILDKMRKQRQEAIRQFEDASRDDLAQKEKDELVIIEEFLPSPLSEDEVKSLIAAAIEETAAASVKDMGKVMALLKPKLQGRTDLSAASQAVKSHLQSVNG